MVGGGGEGGYKTVGNCSETLVENNDDNCVMLIIVSRGGPRYSIRLASRNYLEWVRFDDLATRALVSGIPDSRVA
jgi:hypothetical protein